MANDIEPSVPMPYAWIHPENTEADRRRELLGCPSCGHIHQGEAFAYICIGCPYPKQPPFRKLAL
jgi:hypothetical protein